MLIINIFLKINVSSYENISVLYRNCVFELNEAFGNYIQLLMLHIMVEKTQNIDRERQYGLVGTVVYEGR